MTPAHASTLQNLQTIAAQLQAANDALRAALLEPMPTDLYDHWTHVYSAIEDSLIWCGICELKPDIVGFIDQRPACARCFETHALCEHCGHIEEGVATTRVSPLWSKSPRFQELCPRCAETFLFAEDAQCTR